MDLSAGAEAPQKYVDLSIVPNLVPVIVSIWCKKREGDRRGVVATLTCGYKDKI